MLDFKNFNFKTITLTCILYEIEHINSKYKGLGHIDTIHSQILGFKKRY